MIPGTPLVVEADDLGLSRELNIGIREAASRGALTSACVRMNGLALEEAIREVVPQCGDIGVGIHLNIVEGVTTRHFIPRTSPLCTSDGRFRMSFPLLLKRQSDPALLAEIERDYRDQIERGLRVLPTVDHLNSHQHSHAVPPVFSLVCRLALDYRIPYVRLPRERFYMTGSLLAHTRFWYAANLVKVGLLNRLARTNLRIARHLGVSTNRWLVGIGYTGHMTSDTLLAGLRPLSKGDGVVEALFHPARVDGVVSEAYPHPGVRRWVRARSRAREMSALLEPGLPARLEATGWRLTTYGALTAPSDPPCS